MIKRIIPLLLILLSVQLVGAQALYEKLDELMTAYVERGEFGGSVLIARQGQIVLEKGYGHSDIKTHETNKANTVYQIASVTKTFTAALILKLVELDQLSLNDRLSIYYPDYPKGDSITIENLLTHTSGIYNYTQNRDFMFTQAEKPASEQKMLALFENKELDFSPGTGWNYSNSGYSLLGYIIQKVTKMPFEAAIKKYIFIPLKMNDSGFDFAHLTGKEKATGYFSDSTGTYNQQAPLVDSSVSFSAGSIYSTVSDLYKWHEGLQNHEIIPDALLKKAFTPFRQHYGYGWMIDSLYGRKIVSHSGGIWGFRSNFSSVAADDICVTLLSNTETPSLENITRKIFAVLYGQPYQIPVKNAPVELSQETLRKYSGRYKFEENNLVVEMKLENGELVAYPENGPRSTLWALDETHFFLKDEQDFKVSFVTDDTGKVEEMIIDNNGKGGAGRKVD